MVVSASDQVLDPRVDDEVPARQEGTVRWVTLYLCQIFPADQLAKVHRLSDRWRPEAVLVERCL